MVRVLHFLRASDRTPILEAVMNRRICVALTLALVVVGGATACEHRNTITAVGYEPAPPDALEGWYFDRAVYLVWDLPPGWDGEPFRVYGKRRSDASWFRIAEVTNCTGGSCSYTDVNVVAGVTYEYFVTAVDPGSEVESEGSWAVQVYVPNPTPPPAPDWTDAMALDGAVYLRWDSSVADVSDFSHFRVHLVDPAGGGDFLLGETDSPAFLDERVVNGGAYTYRVTSVDSQGHESGPGPVSTALPRPDYHGEWIWAYQYRPVDSGFRFPTSEDVDPLFDGDDPARHFRFEVDAQGWWLVPGPGAALHEDAFVTTALRCGPGSDASCVELSTAPASGYGSFALELIPSTTYVLRVIGDDGAFHYGAVRVEQLGLDQSGDPLMVFDWAYQLAPGTRALSPSEEGMRPAVEEVRAAPRAVARRAPPR